MNTALRGGLACALAQSVVQSNAAVLSKPRAGVSGLRESVKARAI